MADHQVGDSLPLLSGQTQADFPSFHAYQAKATQEQTLYPTRNAYLSARARRLGYSSYDAWLKDRRRENVPCKNTARAKANRERTIRPEQFGDKAKLYTFRFNNRNYALRSQQIDDLIKSLDPHTFIQFKVVGNTPSAREYGVKMKDWELKRGREREIQRGVVISRPTDVHTLTTVLMADDEMVVEYLRGIFRIENYLHPNGRFINFGIKSVKIYMYAR